RFVRHAIAIAIDEDADVALTGDDHVAARIDRHGINVIGEIRVGEKGDAETACYTQAKLRDGHQVGGENELKPCEEDQSKNQPASARSAERRREGRKSHRPMPSL